MKQNEVLATLLPELRRGVVVLCVLGSLRQPQYGYNLVTQLGGHGLTVEVNTLYPLLRRLEGQGLLQSRWETGEAKPRKYYGLTPMGLEVYHSLKALWDATTQSVQELLEEEEL